MDFLQFVGFSLQKNGKRMPKALSANLFLNKTFALSG